MVRAFERKLSLFDDLFHRSPPRPTNPLTQPARFADSPLHPALAGLLVCLEPNCMLLPESLPIGLRAVIALASGTVASLVLGRYVIRWLSARGVQDGEARKASETLNELNQGKARTPTMGGLFIMLALLVGAIIALPASAISAWVILLAVLATAGLGAYDDWAKLNRTGRDGIRGRTKLLVQSAVALGAGAVFLSYLPVGSDSLWVPIAGWSIPLGAAFLPWAVLVTVGSSNAVNLSDVRDGLAGGMALICLLVFAAAGLIVGNADWAANFSVPHVPDVTSVAILALLLAGAVAGFLWFNVNPAQVFMGDTGSLAIGAALGLMAVAMRQELLLALAGAMFVAEALSVMLQVGYFKATGGKRILRCAPLHHHFQFGGWSEVRVTLRFWLLAGLFGCLGMVAFSWGALVGHSPEVGPAVVSPVESYPQNSLEVRR